MMTRERKRPSTRRMITPAMRLLATAAVVLGLALPAGAEGSAEEPAQQSVLLRALGDELKRTMAELRLEQEERPYFVAYRVVETASTRATATGGGSVNQWQGRSRRLQVELRVGSHALDNTNFMSGPGFGPPPVSLPLTDDYDQLRQRIWLATDAAYKSALDELAAKKAALQNKTAVEEVADLSTEEPFQAVDQKPALALDAGRVATLANGISAAFQGNAQVFQSQVAVGARQTTTTYLNSEGSSFVRDEPLAYVHVTASTQAEDGTQLSDYVAAEARAWEHLPSQEELVARTTRMMATLADLRTAPALERYTGPVLFEGQAAAELVAQVLALRFVGLRMPVVDNPMLERALDQVRNPFLDKLGARVLARSLSVVDDPTAVAEDGPPLLGSFVVDDDGVPAARTSLVENGMLKTLLTSRNPVPDLPNSSGSRRGDTALPSNLFITAKNGLGADEMRAELLALVAERDAEYGVVVRRIASPRMAGTEGLMAMAMAMGGQGAKVMPLTLAYRVFADGREELIGKAMLPTFNEAQFKDLIAASAARTRYDTTVAPAGGGMFGGFTAGGGGALTTIVTPDFLFEDVTVRRPPGNIPRPPVAPHPLADTR